MRLHRFYIENENFETLKPGDSFSCTSPEIIKQVGVVLRAKTGDAVRFFNESGEWELEIKSISKKEVLCMVKKEIPCLVQERKVFLLQSIIKKDKFEWVTQKVTELGITDIIPVISERSEKRGLDEKRLHKIALEATEQSGWGRVPIIHPITTLALAIESLKKHKVPIFTLDVNGAQPKNTKYSSVAICIGPEGGWGKQDEEIFKRYSIANISIGKPTLRAETASIIGAYLFTLK